MAEARAELRADCARCVGLCCVAPAFARSADFAIDKPAGTPCLHLRTDSRCGIHGELRERGFPGCTAFDCLGAGQKLTRQTFGGRDWREDRRTAERMFAAFPVMRDLHELLWYLTEAVALPAAEPLRHKLSEALDEVGSLTGLDPAELPAVDVGPLRLRIGGLLAEASELARAGVPGRRDRRGADLAGARLRAADLRGASLRGALLLGADLSRADLRLADLLGADLRGADLSGADLTGALFVTPMQLGAARGDAATRTPAGLEHPAHWAQPSHHQPLPR